MEPRRNIHVEVDNKIKEGKMMSENKTLSNVLKTVLTVLAISSNMAVAEEGGSGHYLPGSMASFMDGVAAEPTFLLRLNYVYYDGKAEVDIPLGGNHVADLEAISNALGLTAFWAPEWGTITDKWTYAMSATLPIVNMQVSGAIDSFGVSDELTALGDIILMPIMFNYKVNEDFNINSRVAFYAPTGDYEVGRLANTGKNFWTIEPTIGFMYFGKDNGREASVFLGVDFNEENDATNYKSGTQVHIDSTCAQHFPFQNGLAGVGVTAYYYKQVADDSGSGATLGAFRAQAVGAGPVLSYVSHSGNILAEVKYINDFNNEKRLEGDTLFFKIIAKF